MFNLGTGAVSWVGKKEYVEFLSSTEEKYREAVKWACEAIWPNRILGDLILEKAKPTVL